MIHADTPLLSSWASLATIIPFSRCSVRMNLNVNYNCASEYAPCRASMPPDVVPTFSDDDYDRMYGTSSSCDFVLIQKTTHTSARYARTPRTVGITAGASTPECQVLAPHFITQLPVRLLTIPCQLQPQSIPMINCVPV